LKVLHIRFFIVFAHLLDKLVFSHHYVERICKGLT
jgi:hypothetical protein